MPALDKALSGVNQLMHRDTYDWLYQVVLVNEPEQNVEVGTAGGASTIVMALAGKQTQKLQSVITMDIFATRDSNPSSRSAFGSISDNLKIVRRNFKEAGIEDCVEVFVGSSDDFMASGDFRKKIDLLLIDADGRIDRDLINFFPNIGLETTLIIDDYSFKPRLTYLKSGTRIFDLKHIFTKVFVDMLIDSEMIKINSLAPNGSTIECTLINQNLWSEEKVRLIALEAYRSLIFTIIPKYFFQRMRYEDYVERLVKKAKSMLILISRTLS